MQFGLNICINIILGGVQHPGQGVEYMHKYNPWWCSADIWSQMCDQWRDPTWLKRRKIAAENRAAGVSDGEKAKGMLPARSITIRFKPARPAKKTS